MTHSLRSCVSDEAVAEMSGHHLTTAANLGPYGPLHTLGLHILPVNREALKFNLRYETKHVKRAFPIPPSSPQLDTPSSYSWTR